MNDDKIPAWLRRRLYPICAAIVLLAGGYGLVTEQEGLLWLGLAAAVAGTGTATAYRPDADPSVDA